MDLGASRWQALWMVLLPLLRPAIFVGAMVAVAISLDDFVITQFLVGEAETQTIPVRIYSGARAGPTPSTNAIATVLLLGTVVVVTIAGVMLRVARKREQRGGSAVEDLARLEI